MKYYGSPRWSGEMLDCAFPMTFDTYSTCSYKCLYCFSFFQRSIGWARDDYLANKVNYVSVDYVKGLWEKPESNQFGRFIKEGRALQWGGLSDPFDENERELGISLELLKFWREINYPLSISTKATWWTEDDRYMSLLDGADNVQVKISVINYDERLSQKIEGLVSSPKERIAAMGRLSKLGLANVTLRFRPFIIGMSDLTAKELVDASADAGADGVTTEFLCLEGRSTNKFERRNRIMSKALGYDIFEFYKKNSQTKSGYFGLNREIKEPYFKRVRELAKSRGMGFWVSDAHWKELSDHGNCCGYTDKEKWCHGTFTEAILRAKKNGTVRFSEIAEDADFWSEIEFNKAMGFNTGSAEIRAKFHGFTMLDYMRYNWNKVNNGHSPYKYFGGALHPIGTDEEGDIIYEYRV